VKLNLVNTIISLVGMVTGLGALYYAYITFLQNTEAIEFQLTDVHTEVTYSGLKFSGNFNIFNKSTLDNTISGMRLENKFGGSTITLQELMPDGPILIKARSSISVPYTLYVFAINNDWLGSIKSASTITDIPPPPMVETVLGKQPNLETKVSDNITGGSTFGIIADHWRKGGIFNQMFAKPGPIRGKVYSATFQARPNCPLELSNQPIICPIITVLTIDGNSYSSQSYSIGYFLFEVKT